MITKHIANLILLALDINYLIIKAPRINTASLNKRCTRHVARSVKPPNIDTSTLHGRYHVEELRWKTPIQHYGAPAAPKRLDELLRLTCCHNRIPLGVYTETIKIRATVTLRVNI